MENYMKYLREKVGHSPIILPAVAAIIYQDHKILMQKRSDDGKWALHGGAIEMGETYIEALERELAEEIRIKPTQLELYGIFSGSGTYHIYPNQDEVYYFTHVFLCTKWEGSLKADEDEVLELKWFDIDQLPEKEKTMDTETYLLQDLKKFLKDHKPIVK